MAFQYKLKITVNGITDLLTPEEHGCKNTYYGFRVEEIPDRKKQVFEMEGTDTLEDLKASFTKLTSEVLESEIPPKYFKSGVVLLLSTLSKQADDDFESGMEYAVEKNFGNFGVYLYLYKQPAPVQKDPEPDGYVTGSLWNVTIVLNKKNNTKGFHHTDHVFCIKPESAVHEALDRMFRQVPDILDRFTVETPIQVERISEKPLKFPYIVYTDTGDKP